MELRALICLAGLGLLTACSGYGSRPHYFGHEELTQGVPGFVNGQKVDPTVKLGKPYMVEGHTYVPHYDPTFTQEGLASWYGPGFHGGKTANGETYSKYDYTAAHPTLPMPSIVKVTNLKNGKIVYVRINDRGPYAGGRIIDLSRSAAEQIDLVREGVSKVRIEYMKEATDKYVGLLAQGRAPSSIDIAAEVVDTTGDAELATVDHSHWWEFAPNANANEPQGAAPTGDMQVNDLPPAQAAGAPAPQPAPQASDIVPPHAVTAVTVGDDLPAQTPLFPNAPPQPSMPSAAPVAEAPPAAADDVSGAPDDALPPQQPLTSPITAVEPAPIPVAAPVARPTATPQAPAPLSGYYVQLGSFSVESNALTAQSHFNAIAPTTVEPTHNAAGTPMYRVRIGPFSDPNQATSMLQRAQGMGAADAKIIKQ